MATTLASGIAKKIQSYNADPRAIARREGWNPRFDFGEIADLAKSIQANGVLNALRVKRPMEPRADGKAFELIDGDRRLTAIELILETDPNAFPDGVPVHMVEKSQDDLTSLIQMFEANTGKPFLPVEEAEAFKRMRDAGLTLKDIATRIGRSEAHITDTLNLLIAAPAVKKAAQAGEVTASDAKEIARVAKGDHAAQEELLDKAKAAKSGDKGAKQELRVKINKKLDEKAQKKGVQRPRNAFLSAEQVGKLAARLDAHYKALAASEAVAENQADLDAFVTGSVQHDPGMVAAYTAGVLHALKVVAGFEGITLEL